MPEIASQAEAYFTASAALRSADPADKERGIHALIKTAFGPASAVQRQAVIALEDYCPRLGIRITRLEDQDLAPVTRGRGQRSTRRPAHASRWPGYADQP